MGRENRVVRLDYCGGDLRRRIDSESQLGLLAVVDRESLQQKRTQSGASASADSVEHQEALQTSAVVSKLSDSVKTQVNDLSANGVVSSGEVVGSVFFS